MSANGTNYTNATNEYNKYVDALGDQLTNYNNTAKETTGETAYNKSLNMASKGAAIQAQGSANAARTASRNSGANDLQAQFIGAKTASSQYGNAYATQQSNAQSALANKLTAAQQGVNNANTMVSNAANQQQIAQTEDTNEYQRKWSNVGFGLSTAGELVSLIPGVGQTVGSFMKGAGNAISGSTNKNNATNS